MPGRSRRVDPNAEATVDGAVDANADATQTQQAGNGLRGPLHQDGTVITVQRARLGGPPTKSQYNDNVVNMRAATTQRVRQPDGSFVDGPTTWYSVDAWDGLGRNALISLSKGSPVDITGKYTYETYERADGSIGENHRITAYNIAVPLRNHVVQIQPAPTAAPVAEIGGLA